MKLLFGKMHEDEKELVFMDPCFTLCHGTANTYEGVVPCKVL